MLSLGLGYWTGDLEMLGSRDAEPGPGLLDCGSRYAEHGPLGLLGLGCWTMDLEMLSLDLGLGYWTGDLDLLGNLLGSRYADPESGPGLLDWVSIDAWI